MKPTSPSRTVSAVALTAVVLTTLAALLAAMRLRLTAAERQFGWPWSSNEPALEPVLAVVAILATLAVALAWFGYRDRQWRRSLMECLFWPSIPVAAAWLVMPASGGPTVTTGLAGFAAGLVGWWMYRREARLAGCNRPESPGRPRRIWIGMHLAAVIAMSGMGLWGDGFEDPIAFTVSLVLYPIYGLCQLFLVLAVTWPRLQRLAGGRHAGPVATVAVLFALVHWPNPTLMILTGCGMFFWAVAYYRGRSLVVLALSMGLLASLAAQGLPDQWTDHMRAGPRFVRMRAVPPVADAADARTRHLPAGEVRTAAFLADLYPGIAGREAGPDELERWTRSIAACRRGVVAWRFFISDEYQQKFGAPANEDPLPGDVHWTRLPSPWPERIGRFTRIAPDEPEPSWEEFIARLYRDILRRDAPPLEVAGWRQDLSPRQMRRLLQVLLDQRRELAAAPFDTCTCARLRLHH